MSNLRQNCGSTDLRLDRQMLAWDIRGVEGLFESKLLPVWKVESPPFETDNGRRRWHMELRQSKADLLKCILVMENLPEGQTSLNEKANESKLTGAEMLNAAAEMEVLTGAVVNSVYVMTRNGKHECFSDILAKYEEANGWKDWAQKFVEKRRKDGITEYIFGRDIEAYENAIPVSYIMANQDKYIGPDGVLHLFVELLFTSTVKVWNCMVPEGDTTMEKQVQASNASMIERLSSHYKSKNHADLIVECHGQCFYVHSILLAARLPSFYQSLISRPRARKCDPVKSVNEELETKLGEKPLEILALLFPTPALDMPEPGETVAAGDGVLSSDLKVPCEGSTCCLTDCSTEVILLENIGPAVLENILFYVYHGSLQDNIDVLTLARIAHESKKYWSHELTFLCFLNMLHLFRDASVENKLVVGEALREIYSNADAAVFERRVVSLADLKKMYPSAFLHLVNIERPPATL